MSNTTATAASLPSCLQTRESVRLPLSIPIGRSHDLYLVFTGRKGPKLFNFDWWQIKTAQREGWSIEKNKMFGK